MSDKPTYPAPSEWYCDQCHLIITDSNFSLVIWKDDDEYRDYGFRVVHKGKCDPHARGDRSYPSSQEISVFLGQEGQSYLLSLLSEGPFHMSRGSSGGIPPKDIHEFVDLFRRMQVPYYEEARRHFNCPAVREQFSDYGTDVVYYPEFLSRIATHDGECALVG